MENFPVYSDNFLRNVFTYQIGNLTIFGIILDQHPWLFIFLQFFSNAMKFKSKRKYAFVSSIFIMFDDLVFVSTDLYGK